MWFDFQDVVIALIVLFGCAALLIEGVAKLLRAYQKHRQWERHRRRYHGRVVYVDGASDAEIIDRLLRHTKYSVRRRVRRRRRRPWDDGEAWKHS